MNDDYKMDDNTITIEYIDSPGPQRTQMNSKSSFAPEKVNNCCYCCLTICTGGLCCICWIGSLFGICPKCKTGSDRKHKRHYNF
jgi:hypothetical protein